MNLFGMERALYLAHLAATAGEVPVGCVIYDAEGNILSEAYNLTETQSDPTAHAEILAIRAACKKISNSRLIGCSLYVTLEPCPMCAQAISFARIEKLVFGAYDAKSGGVEHGPRIFEHTTSHFKPVVIGGINEQKCAEVLKNFFVEKRNLS